MSDYTCEHGKGSMGRYCGKCADQRTQKDNAKSAGVDEGVRERVKAALAACDIDQTFPYERLTDCAIAAILATHEIVRRK